MQTIPDDIDFLLPFGEALRGFVEQPFITAADLKHTLRTRGIFMGRNEKSDTIPMITSCLLSPREFEELRQRHAVAEDNPKTITRTIPWNSTQNLMDAIPSDLSLSHLVADFANYRIIGAPAFVPVQKNLDHLACEFEIERTDYSKNWAKAKSNFIGELRVE